MLIIVAVFAANPEGIDIAGVTLTHRIVELFHLADVQNLGVGVVEFESVDVLVSTAILAAVVGRMQSEMQH